MYQTTITRPASNREYAISQIPSIQMRDQLTRTLNDIDTLVSAIDHTTLDPTLSKTYQRFVTFVESSFADVDKMRQRSEWLLFFSTLVRDKLRNYSYARLDHDHTTFLSAVELMHLALQDMTNEIAIFETQNHTDLLIDPSLIIEITHQIIDVIVTPGQITLPATVVSATQEMRAIQAYVKDFATINAGFKLGDASTVLYNRLVKLHKKLQYPGRPRASLQ